MSPDPYDRTVVSSPSSSFPLLQQQQLAVTNTIALSLSLSSPDFPSEGPSALHFIGSRYILSLLLSLFSLPVHLTPLQSIGIVSPSDSSCRLHDSLSLSLSIYLSL
ncbi:hypothetical protein VN97_g2955 [Penicillium thymicola]|uniref:Uncharacterized protein n=1 Tax=Penicillium thymicola TaxID=293382 RepID=A0AAI9TN35_PENTH|nr:hypothetical protein VN97_g2955 [Penicillium thymicola]